MIKLYFFIPDRFYRTVIIFFSTILGKHSDKTRGGIWKLITNATYRLNKTIATATIRFIVTVAIFVYKGLIPVVYRMLTKLTMLTYLLSELFFV